MSSRPNFSSHDNRQHGHHDSPAVTFVVGTAFLTIAEFLALLARGIVIVADVSAELQALCLRLAEGKILETVSLGDGLTMYQLVNKHGTPEQIECLEKMANSTGRNGLGQLRALGRAAALELTQSEEFCRHIIDDIIPTLTAMSGSGLTHINFYLYQGIAGGGGSEGGCIIFDKMIELLREHTNAIIDCHCHLLGFATFESRDFQRTKENAGAAVVDWALRASNPFDDKVCSILYAHELYPVGTDKSLRDKLLLSQIQGLQAPIVRDHLSTVESNRNIGGPYGNVRLISSDHFLALDLGQVAGDIAAAWLPQLLHIAGCSSDTGLVDGFHWRMKSEDRPQESMVGILNRILTAEEEELIDSITASPATWKATPVVVLKDGRKFALADTRSVVDLPVSTVKQIFDRHQLLKTLLIVIREELEKLDSDLSGVETEQVKLVRQVKNCIRSILSNSFLSRSRRNGKKIQRAQASFEGLREISDLLWGLEAKENALLSAQSQLEHEIVNQESKLARLVQLLDEVLPQGDVQKTEPSVTALPVDTMLPDLLTLAEAPQVSRDMIVHLVAQGIEFVTPTGLAMITGAADDSLDAIVRTATTGPFFLVGPRWGGVAKSQEQADHFLVYPPVDPEIAEKLLEIHEQASSSPSVAIANTALGSVNIIQLRIGYCKILSDFLNRPYRRALKLALASPYGPLYLANAEEQLAKLGLDKDCEIIGDNDTK